MSALVLAEETLAELERWACAGHPRETCGLLVGRSTDEVRRVLRAVCARNLETTRPGERFELDPGAVVAADADARAERLAVVGFWHSHPDRPAVPSELDRAAAWEGFSHLILSVRTSGIARARSYRLVAGRFREERLVLARCAEAAQ